MKQIIQYQKDGKMTIEELPVPVVKKGYVMVKNYHSLISSGTEKTSVETAQASMIGKAKSRPDLVKQVIDNVKREGLSATYEKVKNRLDNYKELGYSSAGIVLESTVEEFKPGDLVACGGAAANHAEVISVPKNLCVKIPDNVTTEEAAFTTLGSIAMQGVRQADLKLGENVAVIGLGLIGLITVQLLKANGCRVIGLDINNRDFELAKKLGCDECGISDFDSIGYVDSFTKGYGTDAVIITAGTKSNEPLELALHYARKKSKVVVVGAVGMNVPRSPFYEKELDLRISCSYGPGRYDKEYEEKGNDYPIGYVRWTERRNMESVLNLISQKKLNVRPLITHTFPIEQGLAAYDIITGKTNEKYIGILIEYPKEIKTNHKKIELKEYKNAVSLNQLVIGFIGAGNFAQSYLLPNLEKEQIRLKGVATSKPVNSKSVGKKFNFEYCAADASEILNDKEINTVFIATRHDSHAKFVIESLKQKKNIFVEKPLAVNKKELNEIINTYNNINENEITVHLTVGFNRRFSKPFNAIKDFFKDTKEPFVINYRVNAGYIPYSSWIQDSEQGGRIIGEGCHFIDIFDYIINANPVSIYASSIRSNNTNIKNQDNSVIMINYSDGSIANLIYLANGDKAMPKEYCEVFSSGYSAIMNNFKEVVLYKNNKKEKLTFDGLKGHKEEILHFLEIIKNKTENQLPFNSIINTTLLTISAMDSMQSNQVVFL